MPVMTESTIRPTPPGLNGEELARWHDAEAKDAQYLSIAAPTRWTAEQCHQRALHHWNQAETIRRKAGN